MERLLVSVAFLAAAVPGAALSQDAVPTGGVVVTGTATVGQPTAGSIIVNQTSGTAIIDWTGFSVGAGNSVRFENGSGATLNRVTGLSPSQIDGSLSASGSLYLVNPAGIVVGSTGTVSTGGGFVGSTQDVSDADFLAGGSMTFRGTSTAAVVNYGTVGSLGGDVALIARRVENAGTINAPNGTVGLAAGYEVLVRDSALSDGKFVVKVGGSDTEAKTSGVIRAAEAELRANGGNVYALAGNTRGLTKATGIASKGGRIFLTAGDGGGVTVSQTMTASSATGKGKARGGDIRVSGGTVKVDGKLDASGRKDKGGTVVVTGETVALAASSVLNASGTSGGTILVGGDYQGGANAATNYLPETVADARSVTAQAGATIHADGSEGAGGHVVVWSDQETSFAGAISATGVTRGGDAEVSGKAVLDYAGTADLRASEGNWGTLLLDPYNLTIQDASSSGMSGFDANANDSVLGVDTLTSALATANVAVTTGSSGSQDGNITVAAPVTWSADSVLTLAAAGNVIFDAAVTATGANAGLVIQYGAGKGYTVNAPITLSGSTATLQIGETGALYDYTLIHSMADFDWSVFIPYENYALAGDLDASGTTYTRSVVDDTFTGVLAGFGHSISNLTIAPPPAVNVGLFSMVETDASDEIAVRDLTFIGGSVTALNQVGAVAGKMTNSIVLNVTSSMDVKGTGLTGNVGGLVGSVLGGGIVDSSSSGDVTGIGRNIGGLVGSISGAKLTNSHASGDVLAPAAGYVGGLAGVASTTPVTDSYATGNVNGVAYVGGLVGSTDRAITKSHATGNVTAGSLSGASNAGGLVGSITGNVTSSYATGSVYGADDNVGGLIGGGSGAVSQSFATGGVTGAADHVGGLVGSLGGSVTQSYATGNVSEVPIPPRADDAQGLGGLIGYMSGTVSQSYATGDITSNSGYVGGLVGYLGSGSVSQSYATGNAAGDSSVGGLVGMVGNGSVSESYASGKVTGTEDLGGLVGNLWNGTTLSTSYWDTETTSQASAVGSILGTVVSATGLTTEEARDASSYSGWNFSTNWFQTGDIRPIGRWEAAPEVDGVTTISNVHQLQLAKLDLGGSYRLGADIDASATDGTNAASVWSAGGFISLGDSATPFTGTFDGEGHAISGLTITRDTTDSVGLFGFAGSSSTQATIEHVRLEGGSVTGRDNVGALVGTVTNASVADIVTSADVSGRGNVGGLIGSAGAGANTIDDLHTSGGVTGSGDRVGGVIGKTQTVLTNASATGNVSGVGRVGGLVGDVSAVSITGSYASGDVTGSGSDVGGLIGSTDGPVSTSYAMGKVKGQQSVGGLVGTSSGTVTQVFASGDVEGITKVGGLVGDLAGGTVSQSFASGAVSGSGAIGGLAGYSSASILQAYATGSVTGTDGSAELGGLVGENAGGSISESYAVGAVSGGGTRGGLVATSSGAVSSSYWDSETTGQATSAGSDSSYGLTTAQTHLWSSYAGWDFSVWAPADATYRPELFGVSGVVGIIQSITYGSDPSTAVLSELGIDWWNIVVGTPVLGASLTATTNAGTTYPGVTGLTGDYRLGGSPRFVGINHVDKAALTVTATGTQTYGSTSPTYDYSASGWMNGQSDTNLTGLGYSTTATASSNAGGSYTATASGGTLSGAASGNYSLSYQSGAFTVTPAALTVTAMGTQTYGSTSPTYDYSALGWMNGQTDADLTGLGYSTTATATSNAGGTYTATASGGKLSGAASGNYSLSYQSGAFTVTPATLTVTATGTQTYGSTSPTYDYSASGWMNGQSDTNLTGLGYSTTATASSNAGGSYTVTASGGTLSGAASGNYSLTYHAGAFTVTPATLTVTAMGTQTYGSTSPTYDYSALGWMNGQTDADLTGLGYSTTATATSNVGGTYTATASGGKLSGAASGNYSLSYQSGAFTVTPATLTVTATGTQTYGSTSPTYDYSASGWMNGQSDTNLTGLGYSTTATASSNAGGSYTATASGGTLSGAASGNYSLSYQSGVFTVTPATLTVTATGTQTYGSTSPTYDYSALGWMNGQTDADLTGLGYSTTATATSNAGGSYTATASGGTLSGAASGNYSLSYQSGAFTVTPRPIIVMANNKDRLFEQPNPALTYTVGGDGLVNGDTLSGELATPAEISSPIGQYPILQGSLVASPNYNVTFVPGVLAVTPPYLPDFIQTTPTDERQVTLELRARLGLFDFYERNPAPDIVYGPRLTTEVQ